MIKQLSMYDANWSEELSVATSLRGYELFDKEGFLTRVHCVHGVQNDPSVGTGAASLGFKR
jgi:hypothetical protein